MKFSLLDRMKHMRWLKPQLGRAVLSIRNRHLALADLLLLPMAAVLAFVLRLEGAQLQPFVRAMVIYAVAAPLLKMPVFSILGLYGRLWQYASVDEMLLLIWAALLAGLGQGALFLAARATGLAIIPTIPRSIPLIDVLITLVCIAGSRFALRAGAQTVRRHFKGEEIQHSLKHVLIAGAGDAGAMVLRELRANPQTGLIPVGFIDDDPSKLGVLISRVRVLGGRANIPDLVRLYHVEQVIIAMPSASGRTIREFVVICEEAGVSVRIVPGMYALLSGQVTLHQIRDVQIEDLLRREPVQTDTAQVGALLRGRRVLVTGAGGSIGSELCRQIIRCGPASLVLLGHGENSIFEIYNELSGTLHHQDKRESRHLATTDDVARRPLPEIYPVIADIRFGDRLRSVFEKYRPEIVFHAAAHKHVPLMEENVPDAITNNILGTLRLVETCIEADVTHFVLISTDKAVNPTSVMGASKRVAEMIVQQAARETGCCFVAVRFGNVLGSRGSVVPYFQRQIAAGGPVTVTDPEMRRYFMTIPEAVQLVLQAAALGAGGEVFVLDMGEPVRILDLAQDLIRLSGLEPGQDIDIQITGLRPGEKLFEELFAQGEQYTRTQHEKVFVFRNGSDGQPCPIVPGLAVQIDGLVAAAQAGDTAEVRRRLGELVPEYTPASQSG